MEESAIVERLKEKFPVLADNIKIQRKRRILTEAAQDHFEELFRFAISELEFIVLCAITGLDEGGRFAVIYHIAKTDGVILNIKVPVPKANPSIKTVMPYFAAAEIYEREIADLLGVKVEGLPEGKRYPLPDDWPADEYPLRKDWKKKETPAQGGTTNA